jgi:branched-chain amino acid transport system ATP-binding protein
MTGDTLQHENPAPGAEKKPVLSLQGITVSYGKGIALRDVSLDVLPGQTVAALGANGSGKSTLARACSALVPVRTGRKLLDGTDVTRWPAHRVRRSGILYLPEGRGVFPAMTVHENLRMAVGLAPRALRHSGIERAVEMFPILGSRLKQRAGSLSGGEQQMLSVARATAMDPRVIIADELSLGLAPQIVDLIFSRLADLKAERGLSVILIEQFVHRALAFADSCTILRRGEVTWSGPAEEGAAEALDAYIGSRSTT